MQTVFEFFLRRGRLSFRRGQASRTAQCKKKEKFNAHGKLNKLRQQQIQKYSTEAT
jgi:hypothetical protein